MGGGLRKELRELADAGADWTALTRLLLLCALLLSGASFEQFAVDVVWPDHSCVSIFRDFSGSFRDFRGPWCDSAVLGARGG